MLKRRGEVSNHEIVTLAVFLLGGSTKYIGTEDIAVKADQIAPGRFVWRKYRHQINIENVRTFLSDAKKPKNGAYLSGSGKDGWMLTERGLKFAQGRISDLKGANLRRDPLSSKERQQMRSERLRLLTSEAYLKLQSDGLHSVTEREADAFFRVDEYVTGPAREKKIVRIINYFGDDPDLGGAVKTLASKVRRELG